MSKEKTKEEIDELATKWVTLWASGKRDEMDEVLKGLSSADSLKVQMAGQRKCKNFNAFKTKAASKKTEKEPAAKEKKSKAAKKSKPDDDSFGPPEE